MNEGSANGNKLRYWKFVQSTIDFSAPSTELERIRLSKFAELLWNFNDSLHRLNYDLENSNLSAREDENVCPPHQPEVELQLAPTQKCDIPYPGLSPAKPFYDPRGFPWWQSFIEQSHIIVGEFDLFRSDNSEELSKGDLSWGTSQTELCNNTNGFSKLTLLDERGAATPVGRLHFPQTVAILQKVFLQGNYLAPRPVNINCQEPNTGLAPHSDNMNFLFTCHLGLLIPEKGKCIFRMVSGVTPENKEDALSTPCEVQWRRGQMIVADTSFIHSTRNESPTESRYVLSFSIWHPMLAEFEREGIMRLHEAINEAHRKTEHTKSN